MKRDAPISVLLSILLLFSCSSPSWDFPHPPVPPGKAPEQKAWYQKEKGGFRFDAVEQNPEHRDVFSRIDAEVDDAVKRHPKNGQFGFIHTWYETKRRILFWKYGIDWQPESRMNPDLMID